MGLQRALEFVGGAVGVYLAMVACSGATRAPRAEGAAGEPVASAGASGEAGRVASAGGAPGASEGGQGGLLVASGGEPGGGGFAGLISDPTPDAGAQEAGAGPGPETCECPEPPVVPEEVVWEEYEVGCSTHPDTGNLRWAILDLPDVSADRLARAVAVSRGVPDVYELLGVTSNLQPTLIRPQGLVMSCIGDATSGLFYVPSR